MKRALELCVVAALLAPSVFPMSWRGSREPAVVDVFEHAYDPSREMSFEGKIVRIDPPPCVSTPLYSYHVHVQLGNERVEVHLGPCWYMADQKPTLKEGDSISGIGSEATWRSGPRRVIIAREVRRGKEVLRLRDASGKPVWKQ